MSLVRRPRFCLTYPRHRVAFVNGDVITKSEFEAEEQAMTAEVYRRYAGDELDAQVEQLEKGLLLQMIDRKILVSHAQMIYDPRPVRRAGPATVRRRRPAGARESRPTRLPARAFLPQ